MAAWSRAGDGDLACTVTFAAAPCAGEQDLVLAAATVTGPESHEACNSITAGSGYTIEGPGGAVTLRARHAIALDNGFSMSAGAALTAELDLLAGN
jgi:hypothetical protein